jgi:hypothetical protein
VVALGVPREVSAQQVVLDDLPSCVKPAYLRGHVEGLDGDDAYAIATYIYLDGYGDPAFGAWLPKPFENASQEGSPCTSIEADGSFEVMVTADRGCDEKATQFALYLIPERHPHCASAWSKRHLEAGALASLEVARPCGTVAAFGHTWLIKDGGDCNPLSPGPCYFEPENVSVVNGKLHLITYFDGQCRGAEVALSESLGHGIYVFTLDSRIDSWGPSPILGLLTWETHVSPPFNACEKCENMHRELDFEFNEDVEGPLNCDDGNPETEFNAQFSVQQVLNDEHQCLNKCATNVHRFRIDYSGSTQRTTHVMNWTPASVEFTSYYGDYRVRPLEPGDPDFIGTWTYSGDDNPLSGKENARINFYLAGGTGPGGQVSEAIISDFRYLAPAECSDGKDNDGDGLADWDGAGWDGRDPECVARWDRSESPSPCGVGAGLALLPFPLIWVWRKCQSRREW